MSVDVSKLIDADLLDEYHQGLPLSNADLAEVKSQFNPTFNPVSNLSLNFSTDEKVVGTWIDGKPLYQKTVQIPSFPNNTTGNYPHGISYLKAIVEITGYAYTGEYWEKFPYAAASNYIIVFANSTNIKITDNQDRRSWSGYVTLLYTKTTDDE